MTSAKEFNDTTAIDVAFALPLGIERAESSTRVLDKILTTIECNKVTIEHVFSGTLRKTMLRIFGAVSLPRADTRRTQLYFIGGRAFSNCVLAQAPCLML